MAFVVGAYLWSYGIEFGSSCSAGDTFVSGLSMVFNNNRISGSQARTSIIEGVRQAPNRTSQTRAPVHVNFVHSIRTQVNLLVPT